MNENEEKEKQEEVLADNKMGRPTIYQESFIDKVDNYLDDCEDEEVQQLTGLSLKGTELYKNKLVVKLPTIEGFADYIDVSKKSLYNWAELYPDFLHALEKIERKQKEQLISKGLSGDYNSTIAKLILASNHKMTDRIDTTTDGKPLSITFDPIFNAITRETEEHSPIESEI